jgi:hypothetical protein
MLQNIFKLCAFFIFCSIISCASTKIINKSPQNDLSERTSFKPIDKTLYIVCMDTFTSLCSNIADEFNKKHAFDSIVIGSSINNTEDVTLYIKASYDEKDHTGAELGKACLTGCIQGCLLGVADRAVESMFADKYNCEAIIKATLKVGEKAINSYEGIGRFYAQRPESEDYGKTIVEKAASTVLWEDSIKEKALKYAIDVLIHNIITDRLTIVKAVTN